MRTYVVTGAAGAGTTTVAAALAHRLAAEGASTVLLASEPDALGATDAPEALQTRLVSPLAWGEGAWQALGLARRLLGPPWSDVQGHSLLPFPGLDQLAWWGTLREVWREPVEAVVIDAGPLATAQRWLTLPDTIVGGLRQLWPLEARAGEAADRLQEGSWHLRAMARIDSEAAELAGQLRSVNTSVHLVTTPAGHELRRLLAALAPLAMFELNLTDLVVNRAAPASARHDRVAARLAEQFPAMTVRVAPEGPAAPDPLEFGRALYPDPPKAGRPLRPKVGGDGQDYVWTWSLPMAQPGQVTTVVDGRDLLLTVGSARRAVRMPSVLSRCTMVGAVLADHQLRLTFVPNPDVWPRTEEDR